MSDDLPGLLSDQRRRLGNALMANQWDRPTPQDYPVQERASLFPLATYQNGQTGPALPGLLAEPVEAWNALLRSPYQPGERSPENRDAVVNALSAAGGAMTGGLLGPRPPAGSLNANRFTIDYFGTPVRIVGNPTAKEAEGFINRTKYKAARRIKDQDTGDVYIWDAADPALHELVAKQLGINPARMVGDMIGID